MRSATVPLDGSSVALLLGLLSDRIGRRKLVIVGGACGFLARAFVDRLNSGRTQENVRTQLPLISGG